MRIVPARNVLPLIGIAALVLVAATGSTFAKKARASAYAETTKSAHYYCVGAAALATAKRLRWSGASLVASHHKLVH
jgi:hypothetical protein